MYDTGDRLVHMLTKYCQRHQQIQQQAANTSTETKGKSQKCQDLQKEWLKLQLNQMLSKAFFYELQAHIKKVNIESNGRISPSQWEEGWRLVHEMQAQVRRDLSNINDILTLNIQTH